MIIVVRAIFYKNNKYHPQVFLKMNAFMDYK